MIWMKLAKSLWVSTASYNNLADQHLASFRKPSESARPAGNCAHRMSARTHTDLTIIWILLLIQIRQVPSVPVLLSETVELRHQLLTSAPT
jgi:hypothetical protein